MKKIVITSTILLITLIFSCKKEDIEPDINSDNFPTISDDDIDINVSMLSSIYDQQTSRKIVFKHSISQKDSENILIGVGYFYTLNKKTDTIIREFEPVFKTSTFYLNDNIFKENTEITTFYKIFHYDKSNFEIDKTNNYIPPKKTILKYKELKKYAFSNNFKYNVSINKIKHSILSVGDTLTISGKNFCSSGLDISKGSSINIAGKEHGIIFYSDSILKAVISPDLSKRISNPILKNCGMEITDFGEVEIIKHITDSITSKKLYPKDSIIIYGENFIPQLYSEETKGAVYLYNNKGFNVKLDYFSNNNSNSKFIKFEVPSNLPIGTLSIKHKQFDIENILPNVYNSTTPEIISIDKANNISLGDTLIVKGNYFIQKNRVIKPRLYIEKTEQKLIDFNENQAYFLINQSIENKTANEKANKLHVYFDEYSRIYGTNYYSGWKNRIVEKEFSITTQSPKLTILNKKEYYSLKDTLKFEVQNFYYEDNRNNLPYTNSYKLIKSGSHFLLPLREVKGTIDNINNIYVNSGGFGYSEEVFKIKSPSKLNVFPKSIYENTTVTIEGEEIGYSSNYNGFFNSDCIFIYVETEDWGNDKYLRDIDNIKLITQSHEHCSFAGGRRGYLPVITFEENNKRIQFKFDSGYLGRVNNGNFKLKMRARGEDIYIGEIKINQ